MYYKGRLNHTASLIYKKLNNYIPVCEEGHLLCQRSLWKETEISSLFSSEVKNSESETIVAVSSLYKTANRAPVHVNPLIPHPGTCLAKDLIH